LLFSTVFKQHPYREPIIGRRELFDQVSRDAAFAYYQERYIPDRTFMVIAGDVVAEEVIAAVTERLGEKTNRMLDSILLPVEPMQTGRREAHVDFTTELSRMELAWRIPDLLHEDTPALEVLGVLLGQGRSSRLYREIREKKGLVHEIGAGAYTPVQGGVFYIGTEMDPAQREPATAAILEAVERLQQDGVQEAEVLKARRMFLSDQLGSLTTTRGIASDLGGNWLSAGNLDFTRHYLEAVDRVSAEQVKAVARKYLVESSLTVVSLNPKGAETKTISKPAAVKRPEIQKHVFENGLTLLVKEDSRLPMVHMQASFRGGLLEETTLTNGLSRLMARSLIKGADGRTAEEMMEAMESRGGTLGADSGANSFACYAGVLTPDLALGLDLWGDCVLAPSFSEVEIQREQERQLAAIKSEEDHLMLIAMREVRRRYYGEHPYHMSRNGTQHTVSGLTAAQVQAFHAQQVQTGNGVVAVFGDVSLADIVERVGRKFSRMKVGPRRAPQQLPALPPLQDLLIEQSRDKKQAVLALAYPTVDLQHPDRIALDLIDEACSDMASRMFVRIREELGLAYSVGASQILGLAPGAFIFHLSTSPEQLDFAQEELLKEIQKLQIGGLTEAEIDRARMSLTGKQAMQAQTISSLAEMVVLDELYEFGYDHRKETLARIQSIPASEVNAAIHRYLSVAPIVSRVKGR
jgi:zinc protease